VTSARRRIHQLQENTWRQLIAISAAGMPENQPRHNPVAVKVAQQLRIVV
jgi:hypothetical protein